MTTDEALRVAREALDNLHRSLPVDVLLRVRSDIQAMRDALRTIALAVEGSADGGSSQEASTCPHGVPHRWPCDQCDAAFLPATSNDQQEKQR